MKLLSVSLTLCTLLTLSRADPINSTVSKHPGLCEHMMKHSRTIPGAYIPQCDANGNFLPQQCWSSTGYCWCVNVITGEEIPSTKTPPGTTPVTCALCENMTHPSQNNTGEFVPQCDGNGNFLPQQCSGSTGYCWCVNVMTGEEIPNTKTPPGATPVNCGLCKNMMQPSKNLIGAYVPQCDVNGNFLPQQCSGSSGYCWCVNVITGEEIPNTRTPPGTTPVNCGQRKNLTHKSQNNIGEFVVQFDGNRNFLPQQCSGSTGYCWCVNVITGEEIPNTRTPPGTTPVNCGQCKNMRPHTKNLVGAYVPQCDVNGNFLPQQCWASTGYCWCVNVFTGEEIPNTKTPPGTTPVTCALCKKMRKHGQISFGRFIPQCDANGNFLPQQCSGSTGYCWCVNVMTGEEIPNTRTPPGTTPVTCGLQKNLMHQSQNYFGEYAVELDGNTNLPSAAENTQPTNHIPQTYSLCKKMKWLSQKNVGAYVPQCDANGNFLPQQCWASTGYCWCVNVITGEEIPSTKTPPGTTPVTCAQCKNMTQQSQTSIGAYVPKCDANGNFLPQQCWASTGYCWCVNVFTGEEIPNTKTPPGTTPVTCGQCKKMRPHGQKLIAAYVPQCDANGNFLPQQCWASTGYCWCVDVFTGEEIPNTETPPGTTPVNCSLQKNLMHQSQNYFGEYAVELDGNTNLPSAAENTQPTNHILQTYSLCKKMKWLSQKNVGAYVPQCDANGNFLPQQCWASTGYCWCVNVITGEEIPSTKTPPGTTPVTCAQCKNMTQQSQTSIGAYVPQCDTNGNFLPQQCSGSTGYCWCVNVFTGEEIPNTKTPPGTTPVTCALCKSMRKHGQISFGRFIPQCDANGNFLPQQCSGSTGYCWCVDIMTGEEIPNTRTPPGTTPVTCDSKSLCSQGWSRFGKRCFIFIDSPKTWAEAESYCLFEGANLASVHSAEENHFIQALTRGDSHDFPKTWIGGYDAIHDSLWMWSDGSKFNYENWYKEYEMEKNENCLEMNYEYELKWNSASCNETHPSVCAKMI